MAALRLTCLIPAAALIASACSSSVGTYRELGVPVPRGATWAWAPRVQPAAPSGRYGPPQADSFVQQLRQKTEQLMAARGWVESGDTGQADFLLSVDVGDPGTVRDGLRDNREIVRVTSGYILVCTSAGPCSTGDYYPYFMYDNAAAGPWHRTLSYAPCRAPWERCVEVDLKRRADGRLAWSATRVMDVGDVARASPADVGALAAELLEQLP